MGFAKMGADGSRVSIFFIKSPAADLPKYNSITTHVYQSGLWLFYYSILVELLIKQHISYPVKKLPDNFYNFRLCRCSSPANNIFRFVLARSPLEPMCEGQGTCNSLPVV